MAGLPSQASVVVIGGGVMGCSTAYHLAKLGVSDAIVLERNKLTSGTTWHSAAQVRALRSTRNLTDLIRYSVSLYSQLEQETGQATGWINKGSLSIATCQDRLTHIYRQESLARLFGVRSQTISVDEAKERWPLMNTADVVGAVWSPDDGRVSPSDLCAALVKGAKSGGVKLFENTGVTAISTQGGKIKGVETTAGYIRCDALAICTGLWSGRTASLAGANVPVWPCEHFYLLTKPLDSISGNLPTLSDHDQHLYIRDEAGGLLIGCFEPMGKAIDPERLGEDFAFQLLPEDWDHFEPMMRNALHRLPALESAEVKMLLNGPESFTPDGSFLLGEAAETRGLFLGCGMNSVGVATGGGAGMALAHCIVHGKTPMALSEADPKRFPACFNSAAVLSERVPEVLGKHYEISYPSRQWRTARDLRKSPLHTKWLAEGACFTQSFGWERPYYFNCQVEHIPTFAKPPWFDQVGLEVAQAHNRVALFDQSTLGKIDVLGPDAQRFLDRLCSNNMRKPPGSCIYTTMLDEEGQIQSDLVAIRLTELHYRLYVGTAAISRDLAWLRRHLQSHQVTLQDRSEDYAVIAIAGPQAADVARNLQNNELIEMRYYSAIHTDICGLPVLAARFSFVGEFGWEITCRKGDALALYDALTAQGARPAGLLAQTSMRIEKRYLAYGHDMDSDSTPFDVGLDFSIDWESEFIGKQALRSLTSTRDCVTIVFADQEVLPIGGEPVYFEDQIIGKTTSAAYGYRVNAPLAIAEIAPHKHLAESAQVSVNIAGQMYPGHISFQALFDPTGKRSKEGP